MSGGVGPTCDITLPKEHEEPSTTATAAVRTTEKSAPPRRRRLFSFNQLNALALIVILSSSGMVALEDVAFVILSTLYMYFISKIAFPQLSSSSSQPDPPVYGERNTLLSIYVSVGALIGLFLPVCYIFGGIYVGDKDGIKAAAPHVFLLASQVFMEGLSFSGGFSLPVRVFVPVCYNSVRIYTLMEWLRSEFAKEGSDKRFATAGRLLAVANMVFWGFNLFGFLLPFYMPKAFKIYYGKMKEQ